MGRPWIGLVLDNDNLHDLEPQHLMDLLGLGHVDHIVQYSASAGIEPGKNGYHIFVLLDRPWLPGDLKLRLRAWNLDIAEIRNHFQLSRTNNSLRWPLGVSVCQNDKLIYIAPPTLDHGVESKLEGDRILLVKRSKRVPTLPPATESEELLRQRENAVLNQLRERAGLPRKTLETRKVKKEMVAKNPDKSQVTEVKEAREFTYLNLNGGDSWGYYHPTNKPEVLFNLKGEPNYLIAELLPDYYPEALARAEEAKKVCVLDEYRADRERQTQRVREAEESGEKFLQAFRDKKKDQYYVGWIDPQNLTHDLDAIGSKDRIGEVFAQYYLPKPKTIPSVDYRFEPARNELYNFEATFINRYTPPVYLKEAQVKEGAEIPPTIKRVIQHALGNDPEVFEHFLNWLAVIFQYRERTQTAWILQGTTGTGKGLLFSKIIRPLIGEDYCLEVNLENLEEQFNAYFEKTIVLFVDEVDTDQVKQMAKLMARVKNMITEPKIPLRAMRQDLCEVPNHLNLILSSNQPNSMRIEGNDRRFNVCPRQEEKLLTEGECGDELVKQIQAELPDFADYLKSREANKAKARHALDNEPKRLLQIVTQKAIEEVADAFRNGDLAYFMDHRPMKSVNSHARSYVFNGHEVYIRSVYSKFLEDALEAAEADRKQVVDHEHLFAVFELLVGRMSNTKAKLTKHLGHQNLNIMPHTQGSSTIRGLGVNWKAEPDQLAAWRKMLDEDNRGRADHPHRRARQEDSNERVRADGIGQ